MVPNIDPEQVRKLAGWGLTQNDIASFVGCSQSLISLRFSSFYALRRQEIKNGVEQGHGKQSNRFGIKDLWPSASRFWHLIKPGSETVKSRVGKGRPAGSSELRVSPSPSKIPYGGFSPVRLQMDRQWRPSTRSQGLSAVHIRPMTSSYTPPQFSLPGIRDPRRDYPF